MTNLTNFISPFFPLFSLLKRTMANTSFKSNSSSSTVGGSGFNSTMTPNSTHTSLNTPRNNNNPRKHSGYSSQRSAGRQSFNDEDNDDSDQDIDYDQYSNMPMNADDDEQNESYNDHGNEQNENGNDYANDEYQTDIYKKSSKW